ncbi:hypothetical protein R6Q57_008804 [Mikania cordata]
MSLLIDGLRSHGYAIKSGHNHTVFACNQLIHLYSNHGLIKDACKLFDEMPDRNVFTWNAMISAHIKSNGLDQSELVFNAAPHKDSVTYNSILSGYANSEGYEQKAIDLFKQMQSDAQVDEFSLTRMCNLAAKLGNSWFGKHLHSFMVKTGNNLSGFAVSALVDMYSKNGCFDEAYNVFNGCSYGSADVVSKNAAIAACCRQGKLDMAMELFSNQPELNDVVSWNTMITGYAQNGFDKNAIELALCMEKNGFRWNEHTFTSVLNACSSLKCLKLGKELHARILKEMPENPTEIGIHVISGDVQCKRCNRQYQIKHDVKAKFGEISRYVIDNKYKMNDRAPPKWLNPVLPNCRFCDQENCVKPITAQNKKDINWLFLLLGQMLGCCTLAQLKYFCKHTRNHQTGAKDRVFFLTYLGLCKQLEPSGPFDRL